MIPMTVIFKPAARSGARGGRPPIFGTVLAAPDGTRYVVVRCAYSLGEDAANTGSPRVEVWVAFAETDFAPSVVRGSGRRGAPLEWAAVEGWHEIGDVRREEVLDAIRWATHTPSLVDVLLGPIEPTPTTIWDRRVVLPDDERYPRSKYPLRAGLLELMDRRNTCAADEVPAIDAMILNLAPRES